MARDVLQTVALIDNDAYICASQSPGAGAILINGSGAVNGIGYISSPTNTNTMAQRVTLTSGGNDSGVVFAITGTCADGRVQTEAITGGNIAAVTTVKYYASITSIVQSGAVAGTLKVGALIANGGVTKTCMANWRAPDFGAGLGLTVSGTITCTVQHTFGDNSAPQGNKTWFNSINIVAATANKYGNYFVPCTGIRLLVLPTGSATAYLEIVCS
jgi:hypothetical protein